MTKRKQQILLCPKCHKVPVAHVNKYCDVCKAISLEREKIQKRAYQLQYQRSHKRKAPPKAPPQPHKCRTESCQTIVSPKRTYCTDCMVVRTKESHERKNERQKAKKHISGYEWLDDVNAHLKKNGGVYYKKANDMPIVKHESKILRVVI